jgi:hypothetical protein
MTLRLPGLSRAIPLARYAPRRKPFSWQGWDPARVRSAADLPPYLILGPLDHSSFAQSDGSWSARWQGIDHDTHLDVAWQPQSTRWSVRQTWRGEQGGFALFDTKVPLDRVIMQGLYAQFPRRWDAAAKSQFESRYQLTVIAQPAEAYSFCGMPDGAFRSIVVPIAAGAIESSQRWVQDVIDEEPLSYPVVADVRPADDGDSCFVFITLPFAGLAQFLGFMRNRFGAVRFQIDPPLPEKSRPIVIPAGLEAKLALEGMAS